MEECTIHEVPVLCTPLVCVADSEHSVTGSSRQSGFGKLGLGPALKK